MQRIIHFVFDGLKVRVLLIDGQPWWVALDVACALGYYNATNALRLLRDHHKRYSQVSTPGGPRRMVIISKPGLDHLFMRSSHEAVANFRDWIEKKVVPTFETETYSVAAAQQARELADNPEVVLNLALEEVRRRKAAEARIAVLEAELVERDRRLEQLRQRNYAPGPDP